jgi:Ca2+-binding RTX toxin-like protein
MAGADTLEGGLGADSLTGGVDADEFVFGTALSATNVDRIADFTSADDSLVLIRSVFAGIGGSDGAIDASALRKASGAIAAADATDRIILNTTTGDLYYDRDGAGGAAAVKFATVTVAAAALMDESDLLLRT